MNRDQIAEVIAEETLGRPFDANRDLTITLAADAIIALDARRKEKVG